MTVVGAALAPGVAFAGFAFFIALFQEGYGDGGGATLAKALLLLVVGTVGKACGIMGVIKMWIAGSAGYGHVTGKQVPRWILPVYIGFIVIVAPLVLQAWGSFLGDAVVEGWLL